MVEPKYYSPWDEETRDHMNKVIADAKAEREKHDGSPWFINEVRQLRDDIESAEVDKLAAIEEAEDYLTLAEQWEAKYKHVVHTAKQEAMATNSKLSEKICVLIDLSKEYETMLDMYVHRTGVKLTNNNLERILKLKQKGDLIV